MSEVIFASATPSVTDGADATAYSMGTRFTPSVAGVATHGRWRFPATIPHPSTRVKVGIFRNSDSALLGSTQFPLAAVLGAWNEVAFDTPIALDSGVAYTVAIWTPNRYVATGAYPWPVSSTPDGLLVTDSGVAGRVTASADLAFPSGSFNSSSYFADLVFSTGQEEELTAALELPALSLAAELDAVAEVPDEAHVPSSAGWYGLIGILQEARALQAEDAGSPPAACPNDGEPLESGPDGELHCRFDGYVWPQR